MGTFSDEDRGSTTVGARAARSASGGRPRRAAATAGRTRLPGGFLRSGLHRRFVPLLLALTLASSLGVAGLAYFGERDGAITTAQTRAAQDVRVLRQLLADQGAGVTSQDGRLVVGQDNAQLVLNGDTTVVDRAHDATGAYAAIYQLQGPALIGVSGNVPTADAQGDALPGTRLLGDTISGPANDALLGECGAADTQSCHHSYSGVVSLRGVSYVASYAPLYDNGGAFVGALAAAMPLDGVLAPVAQQAVLLALVGLLLGMVALVAGYWVLDSGARRYFAALDAQLDAVGVQAAQVSALARLQVTHSAQQERTAQQAGEQTYALDTLARAMEQGYASLRDSAGELWAEMSQPGSAPDPARTSAQARQAAVVAARVGTGAAQVHDLCRHIALLMRQVIAQSHSATDGGRELDLHASELLAAVEQAGTTLEQRLALARTDRAADSAGGADGTGGTGTPRAGTSEHPAPGTGVGAGAAQTGTRHTLAPQHGQTGSGPRVYSADGHGSQATGEQSIYRPGLSRATGGFPVMPPASPSQSPSQPPQPFQSLQQPSQRGPNAPSHLPPFSMRSTNPPSRFPNPPSRAYHSPSQFPQTPSRFPDTPSHMFGARDETANPFIVTPRTGEWPAQRPAPMPDQHPGEQPSRSSEPRNSLGLPDLSTQDHIPDWRGDESE